jgi:hypothetical protein
MGMGAGIGLGQSMAQTMFEPNTQQAQPTSIEKLKQLKHIFEAELITEQEYSTKKQSILEQM